MSPGCPRRKVFISEISVHRSGKGREGTASCAGGRGRRFFSSLSAAGRVFCGAGLASFPGNRGSLSPASPRNALPPQALGIQRGRAVGAPRVPRPRSSRARQEGFYLSSAAASGREGKARPAGLLSPPWKVFKRLSRVARRGRGRLCLGAQRSGLRRRRLGALPALRRLGWAAAGPCPSCTGRTGGGLRGLDAAGSWKDEAIDSFR